MRESLSAQAGGGSGVSGDISSGGGKPVMQILTLTRRDGIASQKSS